MTASDGANQSPRTPAASASRAYSSAEATPISRPDRRKARTRQALINAARRLLADGSASTASIQDITDAADLGFGTFYNHFEDKEQLFRAAAEQVLEQWAAYLDHTPPASEDPAVVFVTSFRRSGRLLISHPEEARLVLHGGLAMLHSSVGMAPRARRDIAAAVRSGRFTIAGANVELAFSKTAAFLIALLHTWLLEPKVIDETAIDDTAGELLCAFGLRPAEAKRLAHARLQDVPPLAELSEM